MSSESRAIAAFTGVGVLLVGVAIAVARFGPRRGGVDELPPVPTATAGATPAALPSRPPAGRPARPPLLLQHPSLSRTAIAFDYAGEILDRRARRRRGQAPGDRPAAQLAARLLARRLADRVHGDLRRQRRRLRRARRRRRAAAPHAPPLGRRAPSAGRPTARACSSARGARRRAICPSSSPCPLDGRLARARCRCPRATRPATRPTASASRTSPFDQWQPEWKKYRGGQATLHLGRATCPTRTSRRCPHADSNDRYPMWVGDTVYFVSDRNGTYTLFAYDTKGGGRARAGAQPRRLRRPLRVGRSRRHRLRAARRAPPLRPHGGQDARGSPSRSRPTCRRCARASSTSRPTTC